MNVVEPTAICFAFHKQSETFQIAAAPIFLPNKPEYGIEIEQQPHTHQDDKSPFGVNETVVIANGTVSNRP